MYPGGKFASPREVNCAGNYVIGTEQIEMFPPPLEETGGSCKTACQQNFKILSSFHTLPR